MVLNDALTKKMGLNDVDKRSEQNIYIYIYIYILNSRFEIRYFFNLTHAWSGYNNSTYRFNIGDAISLENNRHDAVKDEKSVAADKRQSVKWQLAKSREADCCCRNCWVLSAQTRRVFVLLSRWSLVVLACEANLLRLFNCKITNFL